MAEYIANEVRLGVLIDRKDCQVHLYWPGRKSEFLDSPELVSYEPELPMFSVNMEEIL